jgi:hypothetical protein
MQAKLRKDGGYLKTTNPVAFHRLRMKIRRVEKLLMQRELPL